jgi:uncharacterized membrane protein YphA (DoxX/SURF4 family)
MEIVLWVLQVILALMFLLHGRMMLFPPEVMPNPGMSYILDIPPTSRRLIGVAEILAGIGLILPGVTGILPELVPLAAAGLVIVMAAAAIFHIPRKEYSNIVFNLILLTVSAFVALMRWGDYPL